MTPYLTVELVGSWNPCWSLDELEEYFDGRERMRVLDVLADESLSLANRWWVAYCCVRGPQTVRSAFDELVERSCRAGHNAVLRGEIGMPANRDTWRQALDNLIDVITRHMGGRVTT